jgi:hypothetical protein
LQAQANSNQIALILIKCRPTLRQMSQYSAWLEIPGWTVCLVAAVTTPDGLVQVEKGAGYIQNS